METVIQEFQLAFEQYGSDESNWPSNAEGQPSVEPANPPKEGISPKRVRSLYRTVYVLARTFCKFYPKKLADPSRRQKAVSNIVTAFDELGMDIDKGTVLSVLRDANKHLD